MGKCKVGSWGRVAVDSCGWIACGMWLWIVRVDGSDGRCRVNRLGGMFVWYGCGL